MSADFEAQAPFSIDELHRVIIESVEDMAVLSTDCTGRVWTWNAGAERLTGFQAAEMLGQTADVIFTDEDRAKGAPEHERQTALEKGRAEDQRWHRRKDGSLFWGSGVMAPLRAEDGSIVGYAKLFRDRTSVHEAQRRNDLLVRELNHRVKNIVGMVSALAYNLLRTTTPQTFERAFTDRLQALSRAHDLLTAANWLGASLHEVVSRTLESYSMTPGRIFIEGPLAILKSDSAITLHLMFYELASNAAKYGALSTPQGKVSVRWRIESNELIIQWDEQGGPEVKPPVRRGFGTRLLDQTARQLDGRIECTHPATGLTCGIRVRLDAVAVPQD